ncbi:MAG: DUF488 domain-containing protein [Chloroflexi bacterium]|nr:DUF488 domain-containing protein [Chloroflexota bacterium]MYK33915.1 DUF488 domain-containing protein [Chloroflexota bacterium]
MPTVFTIGHSNQPAAEFFALLTKHNIECLVDVRSNPYSRFRHFNREPLDDRLARLGIRYLYLGDSLGGHPNPDEFYVGGRVAYERVAALPEFRRGIGQVVDASEQQRLALMCTEEDPALCHRHPLLARMLVERDLEVLHIRRDGTVQDATQMVERVDLRMPLFESDGEDLTWVSPKRIRRGRRS